MTSPFFPANREVSSLSTQGLSDIVGPLYQQLELGVGETGKSADQHRNRSPWHSVSAIPTSTRRSWNGETWETSCKLSSNVKRDDVASLHSPKTSPCFSDFLICLSENRTEPEFISATVSVRLSLSASGRRKIRNNKLSRFYLWWLLMRCYTYIQQLIYLAGSKIGMFHRYIDAFTRTYPRNQSQSGESRRVKPVFPCLA